MHDPKKTCNDLTYEDEDNKPYLGECTIGLGKSNNNQKFKEISDKLDWKPIHTLFDWCDL